MNHRSLKRQIKYLSVKERRDRAEKLAAFKKDAMSKHKKKICFDENLAGVIPYMKEKGYNIFEFEKGIKNKDLNKLMNENNVKFFFTANYSHFEKFLNTKYKMFKISKAFSTKRMTDDLANIFDWLLMNYKEFFSKEIDLAAKVINGTQLKRYRCNL